MNETNYLCEKDTNYTCWKGLVKQLNYQWSVLMIPVEVMMCLFMLIGTFGNMLVLIIYSCRRQKTSANIFIMFLAGIDLSACMVIHPYITFKLFNNYDQTWTGICKMFEFMVHTNLAVSGLALLLVAIDRFLAICRPVKFLTFDKHVCKSIAAITVVAIVGSSPLFEFYGAAPVEIHINNATFIGYQCHYQTKYQNSTSMLVFGTIIMCLFLVEIIAMIILYKEVAVTAYRSRRSVIPLSNAHILAGIKPTPSFTETQVSSKWTQNTDLGTKSPSHTPSPSHVTVGTGTSHDNVDRDVSALFSVESNKRIGAAHQSDINLRVAPSVSNAHRKNIVANRSFKNRMKAAKMLFLVTALYFLSWMPFFMLRIITTLNPSFWSDTSNTSIVLESLLNHTFYLNNAVNPIIYTLVNKNFRQDCKSVFKKYCLLRRW